MQQMSAEQVAAINHLIDLKSATLSDGQIAKTLEIFQTADAQLRVRLGEMDTKFGEIQKALGQAQSVLTQGEAARVSQEEYIRGEFVKAHTLSDDMVGLENRLAELNTGLLEQTRRTQEELNGLLTASRASTDQLRSNVQEEFLKVRREIDNAAVHAGVRQEKPRDYHKSLVDTRDYKVDKMPEPCSLEQYKKWRHDTVVLLEAHPRWNGAKKILGCIRKSTKAVDSECLSQAIREVNHECQEEFSHPLVDGSDWDFLSRSRELYQLISVKLNSATFSDLKDDEGMNGFEMWRLMDKQKDPIRKDIGFHLEIAIQAMASQREGSFEATHHRLGEIEKAAKHYRATTGEPICKQLLSRVLYATADFDT